MRFHVARLPGSRDWVVRDQDGTQVAGPFATRLEARDAGPWVVRTSLTLADGGSYVMHGGNREGPVLFFNRATADRCAASWRGIVVRYQ
jgi:hypothetical protein